MSQHLISSKRPHHVVVQQGFTLIELVVVMIVLSIIAGLTAPIFSKGLTATRTITDNLQTIEKLRYAAERLSRELRQINYNGAAYDISTMSAAALSFTSAIDATNDISFTYSGNTLSMSYSSPALSATLTDEVSVLNFAYYDAAGVSTASNIDVAFVEFTLTLQNPSSGGSFTQRTRVALRDHS